MARRLELIEFSMPVSRRGMTASADTRLAYEACTRYIASSINGMEIQATADMVSQNRLIYYLRPDACIKRIAIEQASAHIGAFNRITSSETTANTANSP